MEAVEINQRAIKILEDFILKNIFHKSIIDFKPVRNEIWF